MARSRTHEARHGTRPSYRGAPFEKRGVGPAFLLTIPIKRLRSEWADGLDATHSSS
jgi:hypothetical protein